MQIPQPLVGIITSFYQGCRRWNHCETEFFHAISDRNHVPCNLSNWPPDWDASDAYFCAVFFHFMSALKTALIYGWHSNTKQIFSLLSHRQTGTFYRAALIHYSSFVCCLQCKRVQNATWIPLSQQKHSLFDFNHILHLCAEHSVWTKIAMKMHRCSERRHMNEQTKENSSKRQKTNKIINE